MAPGADAKQAAGFRAISAALLLGLLTAPALAQDDPAPIPFQGGEFTITQPDESSEKTLAFDGREIAHDYQVNFDRIAEIGGIAVAIFSVGDGGNACGPAVFLAWKPKDGGLKSLGIGADECGAPPPAITADAIYFVPYLMPGASAPVRQWDPDHGVTLAGRLTFMPEPDTGWKDVKAGYDYILDAFRNEAVYQNAEALLGDKLTEVATSLLVGAGTEKSASGIVYAHGCVPHACGGSDGFMAIDAKGRKLYFAMRGDKPRPDAWPALDTWPKELRQAQKKAFAQ